MDTQNYVYTVSNLKFGYIVALQCQTHPCAVNRSQSPWHTRKQCTVRENEIGALMKWIDSILQIGHSIDS